MLSSYIPLLIEADGRYDTASTPLEFLALGVGLLK